MITESRIREIIREEVEKMAVFQEAEILANTPYGQIGKSQDTLIKHKRACQDVMARLAKVYTHLKQSGSSDDLQKVLELLKKLTDSKKSAEKKLGRAARRFDPPQGS